MIKIRSFVVTSGYSDLLATALAVALATCCTVLATININKPITIAIKNCNCDWYITHV